MLKKFETETDISNENSSCTFVKESLSDDKKYHQSVLLAKNGNKLTEKIINCLDHYQE